MQCLHKQSHEHIIMGTTPYKNNPKFPQKNIQYSQRDFHITHIRVQTKRITFLTNPTQVHRKIHAL